MSILDKFKSKYKQALITSDKKTIEFCERFMNYYNSIPGENYPNDKVLEICSNLKQEYYKDIEFVRFINSLF